MGVIESVENFDFQGTLIYKLLVRKPIRPLRPAKDSTHCVVRLVFEDQHILRKLKSDAKLI